MANQTGVRDGAVIQHGLEALADPTRRAIFERLDGGPLSVGELASGMPVSRPAVSQHLRVLLDAGLVTVRAEGARRLYAMSPRGLEGLRRYLDRFWAAAMEDYKRFSESEEGKRWTRQRSRRSSRR